MAQAKKAKKTAPKRKGKPRSKKQSQTLALEITGVILFALGVFLVFCLYIGNAGVLGDTLKSFFLGVFGLVGYLLPVILIVSGVYTTFFFEYKPRTSIVVCSAIIAFCLIGVVHLISHSQIAAQSYWPYITESYELGKTAAGSGLFGALYVYPVAKLIGVIGGYVLFIASSIVCLLLATNISMRSMRKDVSRKVKETSETVSAKLEERREKRAQLRMYDVDEEEKLERKRPLGETDIDLDFFPMGSEYIPRTSVDDAPFDIEEPEEEVDLFPFKPERQQAHVPDIHLEDEFDLPAEDEEGLRDVDFIKGDTRSEPAGETKRKAADTSPSAAVGYTKPSIDVLAKVNNERTLRQQKMEMRKNATNLKTIFESFGIDAEVVNVSTGPVITRYEVRPGPGVKVSKIANLSDDIALAMAARSVRIEAPIPGKNAIGIEVPNNEVAPVTLREVMEGSEFQNAKSLVSVALGKDIAGNDAVIDLAAMPHLLIAGTTGSGKSVCENAIILSLLMNATPDEVKLIMIDPKVVEFQDYHDIPHLEVPLVTDARKAAGALHTAVKEMMTRYNKFAERGARNIGKYNDIMSMLEEPKMPYTIVIIDELADLMMVAPKDVEDSICRIAQMGRAAGIHLVIATQRPTVNVVTGLIKANFPSRIAFNVVSQIDSRTIIDQSGAEKLLGKGDMLFMTSSTPKPIRMQGVYVSDQEVGAVCDHIRKFSAPPEYNEDMIEGMDQYAAESENGGKGDFSAAMSGGASGADDLTAKAAALVIQQGKASTSLLQRKFGIGYGKAARVMDELEDRGVIGPQESSNKPREVKMSITEYDMMFGGQQVDEV